MLKRRAGGSRTVRETNICHVCDMRTSDLEFSRVELSASGQNYHLACLGVSPSDKSLVAGECLRRNGLLFIRVSLGQFGVEFLPREGIRVVWQLFQFKLYKVL